jgi:hypothetical protein
MFLETLIFHFQHQKMLSLSDLCNDISLSYNLSITKQSLDERFNLKGSMFLRSLLENSISRFVSNGIPLSIFKAFKRVKIKDSTSFDLPENMQELYPGNNGNFSKAGMSIQFEYDLKTNNVIDLNLHPRKDNDFKNAHDTFFEIEQGDLVIRDLGYIAIDILKKIDKANAFFLNRIKPQTAIFKIVDNKYVPVSMKGIIKHLRKTKKPFIEKELYVGHRKFLPCRVVFSLVPEDKLKEKKKRHLVRSKRRGGKVDPKVLEAIDLNIFITNTTKEQVPAFEVFNIYKLRWQIELIFKTWKQICGISQNKQAKGIRVEIIIYAQLLWIIINWGIISVFMGYFFRYKRKLLSIYKTYKTLNQVKPRLKHLIHNKYKLENFIDDIGLIFSKNHFKEKRKGHISSTEILISNIG